MRTIFLSALLAAGIGGAPIPVSGAQTGPVDSLTVTWDSLDTARFPDLTGRVWVLDGTRDVAGLSERKFRLFEDGVEQGALSVTRETEGVVIALLVDTSGSMRESLETAKAAVRDFVLNLRPEDQALLVAFSNRATVLQPLTARKNLLLPPLATLKPDGGTALYDSIMTALDQLKGVRQRRVIVLLTDGSDQNAEGTGPGSRSSMDACLAQAVKQETSIFTIGLGIRVERRVLTTMAETTGGRSFWTADAGRLKALYDEIVQYLQSSYRVSYRTQNPWQDGELRRVRLQVQDGSRFGEGVTTYWTSKTRPSIRPAPSKSREGEATPVASAPVRASFTLGWDGKTQVNAPVGRASFRTGTREIDAASGWIVTHPAGRPPSATIFEGPRVYLPPGRYRFVVNGESGKTSEAVFDVEAGKDVRVLLSEDGEP